MRNAKALMLILFVVSILLASGCGKQPMRTSTESQKSDFSISVVELSPASPATLATGEKIIVTLRYSFSKPRRMWIYARPVLEEGKKGSYQDSNLISAGKDKISRFVVQNEPGKLGYIAIIAQGTHGRRIYEELYKVDYTFVDDPKKAQLKRDGIGSSVSNISFSPPSPATLAAGTKVTVTMDYEAKTEHGLYLWAIPSSTCCVFFQGSKEIKGKGSVSRYFIIGGSAHVDSVKIKMGNIAGNDVYEKVIPVDYTYK